MITVEFSLVRPAQKMGEVQLLWGLIALGLNVGVLMLIVNFVFNKQEKLT